MPRILALTPYFGGTFPEHLYRPVARPSRLPYLGACLESLAGLAERIVVGVQNDADAIDARMACANAGLDHAEVLRLDEPEAMRLPTRLCEWAGAVAADHDLVYFTEADQVLRLGDPTLLDRVLEAPSIYLAPHRLARVPDRFAHFDAIPGSDIRLARVVTHEGGRYGIENEDTNETSYDETLYVNHDMRAAYGAAYLCNASFYRSIRFTSRGHLLTERAAGIDAFQVRGARALKTKDFSDFYVFHLSGTEFYERLTAPSAGGDWKIRFPDGRDLTIDETLVEARKLLQRP